MSMTIVELFSGTGTLSARARARGHRTLTIDLHQDADMRRDILTVTADDIRAAIGSDRIDMLWASPPCQGFSVAAIGTHWQRDDARGHWPKHPTAVLGLALLRHTLDLIRELDPTAWYVENPRGMMRRMPELAPFARSTVTFCQYGETRMKPTDIWHNNPDWVPRLPCKNGAPCHEAAPRGSSTGTQGIVGAKARARLPDDLCDEVLAAAERRVA